MFQNISIPLIFITFLVSFVYLSQGYSKTWNAANGGSWHDENNWTPTGVPTSLDTVLIEMGNGGSSPANISISGNVEVDNVTLNTFYFNIENGSQFSVSNFIWQSGYISLFQNSTINITTLNVNNDGSDSSTLLINDSSTAVLGFVHINSLSIPLIINGDGTLDLTQSTISGMTNTQSKLYVNTEVILGTSTNALNSFQMYISRNIYVIDFIDIKCAVTINGTNPVYITVLEGANSNNDSFGIVKINHLLIYGEFNILSKNTTIIGNWLSFNGAIVKGQNCSLLTSSLVETLYGQSELHIKAIWETVTSTAMYMSDQKLSIINTQLDITQYLSLQKGTVSVEDGGELNIYYQAKSYVDAILIVRSSTINFYNNSTLNIPLVLDSSTFYVNSSATVNVLRNISIENSTPVFSEISGSGLLVLTPSSEFFITHSNITISPDLQIEGTVQSINSSITIKGDGNCSNTGIIIDISSNIEVTGDFNISSCVTNEYFSTTGFTTSPVTTSAITTSEITTSDITTSEITSSDITTSDVTSSDLTTSDITTSDITTSDLTTDLDLTTSDLTTSDVTSSVVTTSDLTTQLVTSSPITTSFSEVTTSMFSTTVSDFSSEISTSAIPSESTTGTTGSNNNIDNKPEKKRLSGGAIFGIIFSIFIVIGVILVIILIGRRKGYFKSSSLSNRLKDNYDDLELN